MVSVTAAVEEGVHAGAQPHQPDAASASTRRKLWDIWGIPPDIPPVEKGTSKNELPNQKASRAHPLYGPTAFTGARSVPR